MARRLIVPFLLFASCVVQAQSVDPTRPAIDTGIGMPVDTTATTPPSALQSIIQRKDGKPAALIHGMVVALGGRVGESRLARIGEDFVELRGAMGKEILRLTPGIEKKAVRKEKK